MQNNFYSMGSLFTFVASINVNLENYINNTKNTLRRSDATSSLWVDVDRASGHGAVCIMPTQQRETWRFINDFPAYLVSNTGKVKKGNVMLFIRKGKRKGAYPYIAIENRATKKQAKISIHTLVWDHFGDKIRKDGYHVHHIDQDIYNCNINNLELIKAQDHRDLHRQLRVDKKSAA